MNKWKYIDEYESLPNTNYIHCDTRDFHIICNNTKQEKSYYSEDCIINKNEILDILKRIEINSGGKGEWRYLYGDHQEWIKYLRFMKIKDNKYICFDNEHSFISKQKLEKLVNKEFDENILNFIK